MKKSNTYIGLEQMLKEVFLYCGLDGDCCLSANPFNEGYTLGFSKQVKIDMFAPATDVKIFEQVSKPFIEAIQNSPAVKAEKAELTKEIDRLKEAELAQYKEIQRLREFETYYNLHYQMVNKTLDND